MADPQDQVKEPDYLAMSDEEIRNMTGPIGGTSTVVDGDEDLPDPTDEDEDDEQKGAGASADPAEGNADGEGQNNVEPEDDDDEPAAKPGEEESDDGEDDEKKDDQQQQQEEKPAADDQKVDDKPKEQAPEAAAIDYKKEYERLLAPFKANGRDIKIDNVDDAITLMQMGANYNKKMAALKPNLKLMKLLEKGGLLSEDKISFLIDLDRKDPAAINKLIKDSGIDPMDLDAEKASAYKQTAYTVDDREIELDTVIDDIQGTSSYNRTIEIVSNKWDAASKSVIAQSPSILKVINDHVSSGIYDKIQKVIDDERMFGRLVGLSDIEAYRQVGDALHAKGAFNSVIQGSSQAQGQPAPQPVIVEPKPKQEDDDKRKDKKRAASSTKSVVSNSLPADFNPLAMSDEEFSKLVNKQFL